MTYKTKHIAQKKLIAGMMMIFLSACSEGDSEAPGSAEQTGEPAVVASTFEITAASTQTETAKPGLPQGPVVGTVTVVPGTEPLAPQSGGGEAIPLTGPTDAQIVTPAQEEKVARFTEIAPDTVGGAKFKPSPILQYDLGNLVASTAGRDDLFVSYETATASDDVVFVTPIRGQVRYPTPLTSAAPTDRFPIIVFLHGNHSNEDPSYEGYDYMAQDLAAHGYVVVSIDANWINGGSPIDGDSSSQSRAQLILGTLDRLRQIDASGQVGSDNEPGPLDGLKDKLDFDRIGIMGHSRGGQGVSYAIKFNQTRLGVTEDDLRASLIAHPDLFKGYYPDLLEAVKPATEATPGTPRSPGVAAAPAEIDDDKFAAAVKEYNLFYAAGRESVKPYDFKGAFMLAPTDFDGNRGINNVPLAVLLPGCDGDVRDLQGAFAYDHNRFGPASDMAPRYQIMVKGANHNYYNTVWTRDDQAHSYFPGELPQYCDASRQDGIRLSQDNQRRSGNFLISSFMRYHVGGEQKFAAYWNAAARLPNAACPFTDGPCDEWVALSVQKGVDKRKLIQRFERSGSMERNELGGSFSLSGFDAASSCPMELDGSGETVCTPLDAFAITLYSIADHLELAWTKPNATIATDMKNISAKPYDTLTFRIGVVRPAGQEINVTLTDKSGKTATVAASAFTDALYNAPRKMESGLPMTDDPRDRPFITGRMKVLLNMVAIPLKAFGGVDTTGLKELKLTFPRESGKVAITDIELQNFSRETPPAALARK
ncbi:hypothetical protein SAMN05428967_0910 [Phyllobacterium sp. YR620]|uniref:alpha/beta hydrolase family protein n=1 Tax=Phyllobacterium sp. YR620 TaxID=1881066 RepID=UPI000883427E|nr:hypothetical protein [Phyllobacterium sp. YR620]SDP02234.1 hypothetical protein SAMN05428967_0910 [Phyllobacterium sp. YR620]